MNLNRLLLRFIKVISADNRTPKEILSQIKNLNNNSLRSWYDGRTKIGDYTKLFQQAV